MELYQTFNQFINVMPPFHPPTPKLKLMYGSALHGAAQDINLNLQAGEGHQLVLSGISAHGAQVCNPRLYAHWKIERALQNM